MEIIDSRVDLGFFSGEHRPAEVMRSDEDDEDELVEVLLVGGSPWGFTLRGGLEYNEPLLITKVEDGSRAALGRLQIGDEIISVNSVLLNGYRLEAVGLVKSSQTTLTLGIKRTRFHDSSFGAREFVFPPDSWWAAITSGLLGIARPGLSRWPESPQRSNEPRKIKMVDIVTQTMPAESEVHVARNFLTKILRSSMRKNRYKGRTESSCRPHSWHSAKSTENSTTTDVPKSELSAAPEPAWQTKYNAGSPSKDVTSCWGQTNLRQVSCQFSSVGNMESVEPSPHAFSKEPLFPNKPSGGADHSTVERAVSKPTSACSGYLSGTTDHNTSRGIPPREGMFYRGSPNDLGVPSDCHRYLQIPIGNGGRVSPSMEELAGSKFSTGRSNHGPVWHIPEKNTLTPAAPPPPLRSDSFTATRVHEKSLVGSFPEGPSVYPQQISHCKAVDRTFDDHHVSERGHESRRSYNPPSKKDFLHPYLSVEDYNPNQLNPNKLFSLSSTDIRQGQNPFMYEPQHQRQHSDESPFSMYPKTASTPKMQSVGTYYRSLQDLPTNTNNQNQARTSTGSLSSTTFDPNHEGQAHFRYYCITAQQPSAESSTSQKGWMVDEQSLKMGNSKGTTDKSFVGSQKIVKMKYPHPYLSLPDNKNSNGYCKQTMSPSSSEAATPGTKQVISKYSTGEREKESQRKRDEVIAKHQPSGHVPKHQTEQKNPVSTFHRDNPWINKQDQKICPQKTPMLHSLAQESKKIADKLTVTAKGGHQESTDSMGGKQGRRSDRYATTLRNEIQQKKAQLQKSRSAATLTCPSETEEDHDVWKSTETSASSSDGSFTNTYKDHLKEAQAKVLKATSFMRKDLELPGNEGLPGQPSIRSGPSHGQVTRIGGRKRFPMDKKLRSFSEPDKINEIGVEDKPAHPEDIGSFVDRYKFFEGSCKPTLPKRSLLSPNEDHNEGKTELTGNGRSIHRAPFKQSKSSHCDLNSEEQQRLGTFAEYEATWNLQKKPLERRTTGRYHSAENILDSGSEESSSTVCIHERSRSSPSADFYGQKILLPPREFAPESPSQPKDQQETSVTSVSVKEHSLLSISEPLELITQSVPENKPVGATLSSTQRPRPDPLSARHLQVSEQLHPKNKEPETHQPAQPRVSKPAPPQTTCSSRTTQEEQTVTRVISAAGTRSASPNSTQGPGKHSPSPSGPLERNMLPAAELENDQQSQSRGSLPLKSLSGTSCISPDLTITSAERTPSPQFVPQKLTDEPPATLQIKDPHSYKMEETPNTAGRKVPVQIVCAESISERENRNHLLQPAASESSEVPNHTHLNILDYPEPSQPRSSTCAHQNPTRNSERSSSEHQTNTETTIKDTGPVRTSGVSERSEEDLKREELARDIMGRDKSLVDILDQSKMKTTMDLMKGIFPQGEQVLEGAQQRRKAACKQTSPKNTQNRVEDSLASSVSLVSSSTYYSTSAPKAELLIKMKDMQEHMQDHESEDDEQECDLANKKQELIDSLSKKLQVLRDARESLQEDVHDNNVLGEEVEATVQSVCRPNELQKFRMFVGDLDKVVSLLLSLSGRLARVENALNNLEEGTPAQEKNTLTEKRNLLIQQHEDAKELKENLDRRERAVYDILASYLSEERLADYQHFVKMKSALIMEQRKLEDKIKLGEEQLKCLKDSLLLDQRLLY